MRDITRREFIVGAGALAFLAACAKAAAPKDPKSIAELIANVRERGGAIDLNIFPGGDDYVANMDNYVALGFVTGTRLAGGVPASVWAFSGVDGSGERIGPLEATYHAYAKPEATPAPQGLHAVQMRFPQSGPWRLYAEIEIDGKLHANQTTFIVNGRSPSRVPGQPAISSLTPTTKDRRGIDPICTRTPACPFHTMTLADALKLGKPVIFHVGAPALCQSRTCGPNLEEIISVSQQVGDRVAVVHAEVYRELSQAAVTRQLVTPTFKEWGLGGEPWVFLIDKDGKVASRAQGPMTAAQLINVLQPLLV